MEFIPGVTPHLMASDRCIVLHLLADIGDKNQHLKTREHFLPAENITVRLRVRERDQSGDPDAIWSEGRIQTRWRMDHGDCTQGPACMRRSGWIWFEAQAGRIFHAMGDDCAGVLCHADQLS